MVKKEKSINFIDASREMMVTKSDNLIQRARFELSIEQQQFMLYAISKIKPTDKVFSEYTINLKHFYEICGIKRDTYSYIKKTIQDLYDKSWWVKINDSEEALLSWFSKATIITENGIAKAVIKFHEDMFPYLLNLKEHFENDKTFYTQYRLKCVLAMKSKYSPRMYEVLKSYQKNNNKWFFEIDQLKEMLMCKNYLNKDFKKNVLDVCTEEINKFTDLKIVYQIDKEGRKFKYVNFFFVKKNKAELRQLDFNLCSALDGEINIDEIIEENNKKLDEPGWKLLREHYEQNDELS